MAELTDTDDTDIRERVRERYAAAATAVAESTGSGCCGAPAAIAGCGPDIASTDKDGNEVFGVALYDEEGDAAPRAAVEASLGCGVPTAVADLHEGETVLDLGSGAGADVLISARRVGASGRAIGLDMTDEMLELARANAAEAGVTNVEFLKGYIEDIPLPDDSVDVVISNCVINLSADKRRVLAEVARVLQPGRPLRGLRRDRRPRHGRGHPRRHAAVDRLHRRRAYAGRVRGRAQRRGPGRHRDRRDPPRARARQLRDRPRAQAGNALSRAMAAARGATAAYPLLLALGALDATGYSVIVPVAPAIADATGAGPATIGLLVASFPAGMVAGFALAGWLVRVAGAKRLLAGSLVVVALGALGFVLGDSLAAYFPSRLLMGVGSGGIWIGVTFDTLERWPGQEYVCMSRVFAAYSVGGLIGPALGVVGGIHGPFLAYLVLLVLAMPLVLLVGEPSTRRDFAADRGPLRYRGLLARLRGDHVRRARAGRARGRAPAAFRRAPQPGPDRRALRRARRSWSPSPRARAAA